MTSKTDIPSSSFSSPPFRKFTYDVFLSFRGEDTRKTFTDHLYNALKQKGIFTFRDDEELERGETIDLSLLKAIEESRYVIVVFSKNYANSSWCLDEIGKVVECMEATGQEVFPVFYHIDPSEVRKQTGEHFGQAFEKHEKQFEEGKVQRWKDALLQVGNLSGWHIENGYESKYIQEIVQQIFTKLNKIFSTSEGLVGMDSHLKEMLSHLDIGCPDVRILGICGMGGIGKTTLAHVVFDRIKAQFESHSFLENVREETEKQGTIHLQKQLLLNLLNTNVNVENTKLGRDIIRHRLCTKRVLVVLDDVDQEEQFEALCDRTWFGRGSRIIVTSRDEHLLSVFQADQVYKVNPLSDVAAFQLFSLKASKGDQLIGDFLKLSKEFLKYADGLPLAIKVLGSSVHGRNAKLWLSALDRLEKNPEKKIINVLNVSYNGLEESQKSIFLDIACFFKGKDVDRVRRILQGSNAHCPDFDLQVLLDKSMITLLGEKLWMHDMIQELGWVVVCRESELGRRRSLWRSNEIIRVLDGSKATSAVQSISLHDPTKHDMVHLLDDSFSNMDNLRLLKIRNIKFSGNIKFLSNELQYLEWDDCPLESFPSNFQPDNLVELHMHSSSIQQLWRGEKGWSMLRLINLSGSKYLLSTPDFTEVPHLELLNLKHCTSLVKVHPSLGCLKKLTYLIMKNCNSVESIPPFTNLESLQTLNLSLCSRLKKFPEITGNMKSLLDLSMDGTSIEELPASVACLTGLTSLKLRNCKNLVRVPGTIRCSVSMKELSLAGCSKINDIPDDMEYVRKLHIDGTDIRDLSFVASMKSLKYLSCRGCKGLASESYRGLRPLWSVTGLIQLDLSDCSLMDGAIPDDLSSLISLTTLYLSGNCFVRLPESISQLSNLETLYLNYCRQLQLVPKLPSSVQVVYARDCNSLMDFPNQIKLLNSLDSGFTIINSLNSDDSSLENQQTQIRTSSSSTSHGHIAEYMVKVGNIEWTQQVNVVSTRKELELHRWRDSHFCVYSRDEIPEWISTRSEGNRISIPVPYNLRNDDKWHGVAMCAIFTENRSNRSVISLGDPDSENFKQLFQCTLTNDIFPMESVFIEFDEKEFRPCSHLLSVFYIPKFEFPRMMFSNMMSATFETSHPSSWEIQICGIRLVYEQDAGWLDNFIPETQRPLLNEVKNAILNSGWISRVDTFWKWEPCTLPAKEDSTTILQTKNLESVFPRYLQAEKDDVLFRFNLNGCPGWCMNTNDDRPSSSPVSIRLSSNLHNCKKWMGIVAYASIAEKEPHTFEETYHVSLELNIGGWYMNVSTTYDKCRWSGEPHQLWFVYITRAAIIQEFTQMSETTMTMDFRTDSPEAEVQMRGIKIVDNQEGLEKFAEVIINCIEREDADSVAFFNEWLVERWIELLRLKGHSYTPNKRYSRTRRERKFELLSQKYRKWDWSASAFYCYFLGDEFCRKKWFMHFNEGNSAEIILPLNLFGDHNWLGIAVCAIYWNSHEDHNNILDTPDSDTNVLSWHLEFDVAWARLCIHKHSLFLPKLSPWVPQADWTYYVYVSRTQLGLRRQCRTAKATFRPSSPCLEVRRCALRLVYKQDIEDLVQSLTLCELP